jgi:pimeloyl-ACP methyl ester carboxylesterase
MPLELVRVTTNDEIYLDGALALPEAGVESSLPVDAFLLLHGTGSNFYAPGVLESFAQQAVQAGVPALRMNTRGHDAICSNPGPFGALRGGAAYESIADCRSDLHAGINELLRRGYRRIALVGHSMGGVKAIYTMAQATHPAVSHVVTLSAPRFQHAAYMAHPQAEKFRNDYEAARAFVDDGMPDRLMSITLPLPMLITACNFLEKYGPEDTYDIVKHLPQVGRPVLLLVGTESITRSPVFSNQPEEVGALSEENPQIEFQTVKEANTNYTGLWEVPFTRVRDWLSRE